MATLKASCSSAATATRACAPIRPALPARRCVVARASKDVVSEVGKVIALSSTAAAAALFEPSSAQAAQELLSLAASDNRAAIIGTLFVPALGWVGFNMLQPLLNQLDRMSDIKDSSDPSSKRRGIATAVGLGTAASLLLAEHADAATEVAQLAASDNRATILLSLFVPALGWVGFNMLQPALNQLNRMDEMKGRSVATAVGLGAAASMLLAEHADAATEVAQLAASDNRGTILLSLFVPALGWVGFNMLQPALNQLNRMDEMKGRSVATAVGLGAAASMLIAEHADAATEVAQLAASDNRGAILASLFVPALGWVGFNMLQPALNQMDRMSEMKGRSVATAVGLGAAASLLLAENADAVTEVAQLAASDNRLGVIATLFVPALGWVGYNMLQPLLNQLNRMTEINESASPSTVRKARK